MPTKWATALSPCLPQTRKGSWRRSSARATTSTARKSTLLRLYKPWVAPRSSSAPLPAVRPLRSFSRDSVLADSSSSSASHQSRPRSTCVGFIFGACLRRVAHVINFFTLSLPHCTQQLHCRMARRWPLRRRRRAQILTAAGYSLHGAEIPSGSGAGGVRAQGLCEVPGSHRTRSSVRLGL